MSSFGLLLANSGGFKKLVSARVKFLSFQELNSFLPLMKLACSAEQRGKKE